MKNKSLGLTLLCWVETILAARVLLFTVPVLISKNMEGRLYAFMFADWFILALTFIALLFLVAGFLTLLGNTFYRLIHYVAAGLSALLGLALVRILAQTGDPFSPVYLVPFILALIMAVCIAVVRQSPMVSKGAA